MTPPPAFYLPIVPFDWRLRPSEVQAKGAEVAGGVVGVDHGRGRHGHEELVAGPQLKQASLVDGVEGVLGVRGPALGPHSLQELHTSPGNGGQEGWSRQLVGSWCDFKYLYGAGVGGLLVDALNQLVANAALVPVARRRGRVAEIHLKEGTGGSEAAILSSRGREVVRPDAIRAVPPDASGRTENAATI